MFGANLNRLRKKIKAKQIYNMDISIIVGTFSRAATRGNVDIIKY